MSFINQPILQYSNEIRSAVLIIYLYLRRKPDRAINVKGVISTYDMERLKSLRRLFIKENICFDSVEKIQIIIDELICLKHQVIPFYDIGKFIVNPLVIVFIPWQSYSKHQGRIL